MESRRTAGTLIGGVLVTAIVIVVAAFVLFPLGAQGKLPGQSHPTPIPVTPFANVTTPTTLTSTLGIASTSAPSSASSFAINADQSQAKVTVNEKLAFSPSNSDAVLTTNALQGQIVLGQDGKPMEASKIQVDLRTLKSDAAQRDNWIRANTLQSDQFPLAVFVVTGVNGWTGPLQNGQQSTFKLIGQMTIHGVTKPVTLDVTATMSGATLTGTGKTSFTFEDFGMAPSNKANIVTVNDQINLEMDITATKSA